MNENSDHQSPPILPAEPIRRETSPWQMTMLVIAVSMPFPILAFGLFLAPGGINLTMDAPSAALRTSVFILPIPVLVLLAFGLRYSWCRWRWKTTDAPSRYGTAASLAVVLFWGCALGWQSHNDAVFQRNLEARLQPWAESILSRPRAEVLKKDRSEIREDLVPAFVGRRHIRMERARESAFGANEDSFVVVYGAHDRAGGYVVGRKTLRIEVSQRGAHKVKDGLYLFQDTE